MKSVSGALAALAVATMVTMSTTPAAEAGPLRDALKREINGARFVGSIGVIAAKCATARLLRRPGGRDCTR
jgi:hypothetical protein